MLDPLSLDAVFLVFVLLGTGLVTGFLAGLLGIGGGVIMVPVLHSLFLHIGVSEDMTARLAIGTSLAVIVPTSVLSARAHDQHGAVDRTIFWQMAPGVFIGVMLGAWLAAFATADVLRLIFACVAMGVAITMVLDPSRYRLRDHMPSAPVNMGVASVFGFLSSLMGVAGGGMNVPYMTLHNVPIHRAVGTSAALGTVLAVPGMVAYALAGWGHMGLPFGSLGYVNMVCLGLMLPGSLMLAPLGARVAHALPVRRLRLFFAGFILLIVLKMLAETF